jgi:AcrR family transcriptional regulator
MCVRIARASRTCPLRAVSSTSARLRRRSQSGAAQGIEGLTLRRLASALGVVPNAPYTYFLDKAASLDAVLDDLIGEVERPRMGWRAGLVALMSLLPPGSCSRNPG